MRKHLLTTLFISSVAFLVFTGCGKDDDPIPQKTNTEKLTASPWIFEKAIAGGVNVSTNPQLACYVDNVITFMSNLSGTISEGAVVCTAPAPANFTWSFQSNETVLRLSFTLFPGGSPDFNIVSLTETNLVLSQQMTFAPFPPTLVEVTFKH